MHLHMNTYMYMAMHFSSGRGSFLPLSDSGHAGGPRVYCGASLGLGRAPCRALGVQSRGELACFRGLVFAASLSAEPEPSRSMEK